MLTPGLAQQHACVLRRLLASPAATLDLLLQVADAYEQAAQSLADPAYVGSLMRAATVLRDLAPAYPPAPLDRPIPCPTIRHLGGHP